jgi:Family of unknown function (DUF6527)
MGAKLHCMGEDGRGNLLYAFHCPGCEYGHHIAVPRWTWNESFDKPTVTPSLLVNGHDPTTRCHSIITNGRIQFLGDCFHMLAGNAVDLPDWDEQGFIVTS